MSPQDDLMMLDDGGIPADLLASAEPEMGMGMGMDEMMPMQDEGVQSIHQQLIANIDNPNIAADLDDEQLSAIGQRVLREYELDLSSRSEWEARSKTAMDLAMQIAEKKTNPWPDASNVVYPLMTTAAVQFNARAYPAVIQGRNVVKGVVIGPDKGIPAVNPQTGQPMMQPGPDGQPQPMWMSPPGTKQARATKIGEHMSYQLLDEMTEWENETDILLLILPIVGCTFRKSFYDRGLGQNASMLVLAQNLVIKYDAKSMERAPRLTERIALYPYEIEERVRQGLFLDHEYGKAQDADGDDDAPHEFLEQHRLWDLDDDGYQEPYIVTVHKQTGKVARIVARYDAEGVQVDREGNVVKIDPVHYYTKYDFLPNPEGGIYGTGFGQLLGPINEGVNTTLNMLFDAGHLQNTGGGFVGRGLSMHSGSIRFKLGEWKVVNAPGQSIRDAIVPFNHPGPSPQLIALLTFLVEAGKEVATVKDVMTGGGEQLAATMQPTTLMALIEQGTKVFNAIFKRVYRALKSELNKLYRLNRIYLPYQARYQVGDEWRTVTKEDYARAGGVRPVADPAMASDMQRLAKAQLLQGYQNDPNCNRVKIIRRVFDSAQIEDADDLIVEQTPPNPQILAETAKLEAQNREIDIKEASAKAAQIKDITQAVKNLAEADKANGEIPLEQTAQYIKLMELQLKALLAPAEGQQGSTPQQPAPPMPMLPQQMNPMVGMPQ